MPIRLIDFEKEWNGNDMSVALSQKERAVLLQLVTMLANNPAFYWLNYDTLDPASITDFTDNLLFHLLDSTTPPAVNSMLQIDLFSFNATPLAGIGTLTYNVNTNYPFGYNITTQDISLYGMTQPVWLKAGEYDYTGWYSKTTLCGNTGVAITNSGGVVATIIASLNQNGLGSVRYSATGTFTIPEDGLYNMVVGNVSPVSGNEQCSWISHHIRQTA